MDNKQLDLLDRFAVVIAGGLAADGANFEGVYDHALELLQEREALLKRLEAGPAPEAGVSDSES